MSLYSGQPQYPPLRSDSWQHFYIDSYWWRTGMIMKSNLLEITDLCVCRKSFSVTIFMRDAQQCRRWISSLFNEFIVIQRNNPQFAFGLMFWETETKTINYKRKKNCTQFDCVTKSDLSVNLHMYRLFVIPNS